ncbi:sulfurtransferase [Pontibacillus litoralis]|uniref:3-mercaptopyruvate sulfurtransferase n=1 Tax=Pontibacillus litoralis JSM 072002 TaxID=1385512 RepID=A0A0A5G9R0_9BACI|nr:sulfurtransferase [Pontibacillus litoralis]KGX87913.1 3-mercaptopyruvate sulfurtransferase [Pontibacillus litoralis JSM 072002]
MRFILSAEEVVALQAEKHVTFVDCRFQLDDAYAGYEKYKEAHLPGAIYLDLEKDLSGEVEESGGRHPMPNLSSLVHTLEQKGVSDQSVLVVYDDAQCPVASRCFWLLKVLGHQQVYILDGGYEAWRQQQLPVSSAIASRSPVTYKQDVQQEWVASQEEIKQSIENENVTLMDARSYERYAGWSEPVDSKAGHIPSAVNIPWNTLINEEGNWKSIQQLRSRFTHLNENGTHIVYCGSGVTAMPVAVALKELGFKYVKVYVGSFSDWISDDQNAIAVLPKYK